MNGGPEIDADGVAAGLDALREDAAAAPRPGARAEARRAMHRAVAAGVPRRSRIASLLLPSHPRRLVALTGAFTVAAAATVVAAGWNAPAGSAFHDVRLAREHVALSLAGDPDALRLSYAEARIREAASGADRNASLAEAADLLSQVRTSLSATSPLWPRYTDDERELSRAESEGENGRGSPAVSPATPTPSRDDGSTGGGGSEQHVGPTAEPSEPSSRVGGDTGETEHSTTSTSTRTPEPVDGAEGSASTPFPTPGGETVDH